MTIVHTKGSFGFPMYFGLLHTDNFVRIDNSGKT